jgi:diaphanous 1
MCSRSDNSWHLFMIRFANSVQHITGQELEVRVISDSDQMTVVEQEMEALRTKVDELSDEVSDSISTLIVARITS